MKTYFVQLVCAFVVVAYSQVALADGAAFSIEELHTATKGAVEIFSKDHAELAANFTGYKSWLSGEEAKVKVYVNQEGIAKDFSYLCHKHDLSIECHAQ